MIEIPKPWSRRGIRDLHRLPAATGSDERSIRTPGSLGWEWRWRHRITHLKGIFLYSKNI